MKFGQRVATAKAYESGVFFKPDLHAILEVTALKIFTNRHKEECFCAEFNVLESQHPEGAHKAGTTGSWLVNFKNPSSEGNVQKFFEALFDMDIEKIPEDIYKGFTDGKTVLEKQQLAFGDMIDQAMADNQPAVGSLIIVDTRTIQTREKKEDFTLHTFTAVPAAKQADTEWVAGLKAAAGLSTF